jgi:8-oxo-dGTP pyrophosphatase MutT (NUDIX family)
MDPKESAETCAIRELKEETGYVGELITDGFGISPVMFNGELNRLFHLVTLVSSSSVTLYLAMFPYLMPDYILVLDENILSPQRTSWHCRSPLPTAH